MAKGLTRTETTHIDELTRSATCTLQWLAEKGNLAGAVTHPITHNNKLTFFVCGQDGFADIADQIIQAKDSIDLCCWGFDPGMELLRDTAGTWPRGKTFGDLLIAAGKRGVTIRLLVWYDILGGGQVKNMPGYSHGILPWYYRDGSNGANEISAIGSLQRLSSMTKKKAAFDRNVRDTFLNFPVNPARVPLLAREEYCHSWYKAAFAGLLTGISVRTRSGDSDAIEKSLKTEPNMPAGLSKGELEKGGLEHMGTHHQKSVLIDYSFQEGNLAVGYVMGLNSVTDYWDSPMHLLEDPLREQGGDPQKIECVQEQPAHPGFKTLKPFQDYGCRLDGGRALIDVHKNFVLAWDRADKDKMQTATVACTGRELGCGNPPSALLRKAMPGDSTVQIVRTQPEEGDRSIKDAYWLATSTAASVAGYLFIENQYFQYEDWAKHLMDARRDAIRKWKQGAANAGRALEEMPIMHVFIVIPVPERAQMIPRTHDTLATLGQHAHMAGQEQLVKDENEQRLRPTKEKLDVRGPVPRALPNVVKHANTISRPDLAKLSDVFGLKICVAMLNTCGFDQGRWRYREIYIHSKLMLANDVFFTLGSANLNQRSMVVDSELNMAVTDPRITADVRRRVWGLLSGGDVTGGNGGRQEIQTAFKDWQDLMNENSKKKVSTSGVREERKMTGFVLPLNDLRSSVMRLG